ncbi:hypothetical protein WN982_14170 [Paraburkholderia sp. IMGN_8]|uniref:hypothetical protein n=1 Tax=Paraburkholderia sp. IMGN_8 TaxID=3136564 RepID=UPI0031015A1B
MATETHACNGETSGEAAAQADDQSPDMMTLAEAIRAKETWLARLRQLECEQRARKLIELALAEGVVFELCRQQRDALLAWPVRIAPIMAAELGVDIDHLATLLAEAVYQQLLELSEMRADFTGE